MLLRHSLYYSLARGLPGLVSFAALLAYARLLTPDDYGRYAVVLALVSVVGVLAFLPLIVTFALGWIIAGSDRLLIAKFLGVEAAGQYSVGYDLAQYTIGVLAIVQLAAYPLALRELETSGPARCTAQLAHSGELIMSLALSVAAGLVVLA